MPKKMKVVMIEYIDDNNVWNWYAVVRNTTPQEALKLNCEKEEGEPEIEQDRNIFYLKEEDKRAFYIEI